VTAVFGLSFVLLNRENEELSSIKMKNMAKIAVLR